jgi:hypothetical protein
MGNQLVKSTTPGSEDNTIDNNNEFLRYIEGILEDTATMQNSDKKAANVACSSGLVWKNRKPYLVTGSGSCTNYADNNYKTVRNRLYEIQLQSGDTLRNSAEKTADEMGDNFTFSPSRYKASSTLSQYIPWCNLLNGKNNVPTTTCAGSGTDLEIKYQGKKLIERANKQLRANAENIQNAKEELCTLAQTNISNCIRKEKLINSAKTDAEIYNTCNSVSPNSERISICSQKCKEANCPVGTEKINDNLEKTCPIDDQYAQYNWLAIDKNTCNRVDNDPTKSCCQNKSCTGADVVPPNGTKGDCSSNLVHGTSCTPTCNS